MKQGIKNFKTIFLIEIRSKVESNAIELGILLEKLLQEKMESNMPGKGYNVNHPVTSVEQYLRKRKEYLMLRKEKIELLKLYRELFPEVQPGPVNNIDMILLIKRAKLIRREKKFIMNSLMLLE